VTTSRANFVSGLLGGLVVLALGAILIATGVIDTGGTKTVVRQAALSMPSAEVSNDPGNGSTVEQIYKRDSPGVVFIEAKIVQQTTNPFGFPSEEQGSATGSGFVIDKKGDIITNAHVVQGASQINVRFGDSQSVPAKVVGSDLSTDLALLKVDPGQAKLHPLTLGDSSKVSVGDAAIAIGNPFGYDRTVTTGIISALQRQITAPNNFTINNVIQTDAAINPGNSGGPLLDSTGKVIGITSQIATAGNGSEGNVGIGFAIPIDTVKAAIPQLEKSGKVQHAYLGVTTAPLTTQQARDLNLPSAKGALVQSLVPGGPAAKAGLRAGNTQTDSGLVIGGDLIVKVGSKSITKPDDLAAAIASLKPGDKVKIQVYRDGKLKTLSATLGNRPVSAGGAQSQTLPSP
jgi:S1-C subfamily serine protease